MGDVVDNLPNSAAVVVFQYEDVPRHSCRWRRSRRDRGKAVDLEMKVGEGDFDVTREIFLDERRLRI